jgi:hypothetical protein
MAALLTRRDSPAALALRWGLHGLRATLQAALDEVPASDAGCEDLRALLTEFDDLLAGSDGRPACRAAPAQPTGDTASAVLPVDSTGDGAGQPRLLGLARAVAEDSRLSEGKAQVRTGSDEEIWGDVQRLLLRLPPALAEEWQRRSLQLAEQAGARANEETSSPALPLAEEKWIYPGLSGAVRAAGLRSSPTARLDPRITALADGGLRSLAGITSACLWFAENDPLFCHCLKSVFRFGVAPLAGEQRERYVAELLRLWERVRSGNQSFKERLRSRLDLDEALHSLIHRPPAASDSWWGKLREHARATLLALRDEAAAAGFAVHLQVLGGPFAEISRLAPDSLQVDFGTPGEVCACLRVWARVGGEEWKGRVLYRSPAEGT